MIGVWIGLAVIGMVVAAAASKRAVTHALDASESLGLSAGLTGAMIVAVGTDLPEIGNSISSSLAGHGDLNVGDSTGSALTQVTLVLAILIVLSRGLPQSADRPRNIVVSVGALTVGALLLLAVLLRDGHFARLDGLVLVSVWVISMVVLARRQRQPSASPGSSQRWTWGPALRAMAWLAVVGASATVVVQSFIRVSEDIGIPEFVAGAVVLSLGTSLPELVVDWTAIKRGAVALAIGDLFGSSLVDATLSVGIGPMIRPTAVSSEAVQGALIIAVGIALATFVAARARTAGRATAAGLLAIYLVATALLILIGSG
jgi:cation:H+ antiporter